MKVTIDFSKEDDKKKLYGLLKGRKPVPYIIELTEIKPKRSLDANKYYWAILNLIAKETGNDADDLHEYFKERFIGKKECVFKETGETFEVAQSSSELEHSIFCDYTEKIRMFALQDLNIYIFTPKEYLENWHKI